MKVLTIKQPFVDLILEGKKNLEIRTWQTRYRGRLYLHSSKSTKIDGKKCGYILGYVYLADVKQMTRAHEKKACIDYIENAYSWVLINPAKIKPIPCNGKLSLWDFNINDLE